MGPHVTKNPQYWFPAKRYGWGWGPPTSWQGWTVLVVWFAALLIAALAFLPRRPMAFFSIGGMLGDGADIGLLCQRRATVVSLGGPQVTDLRLRPTSGSGLRGVAASVGL